MDPYVGEIRMIGGSIVPSGWATCDGRLLDISEYQELYDLLGTTYGGDGATRFAVPDLRGRLPVHQGQDLSLGQAGGQEQVTLTAAEMPSHSHGFQASTTPADGASPEGQVLGEPPSMLVYGGDTPGGALAAEAVTEVGGGEAHENLQPYVCLNFIIALRGVTPPRS